MLLNHLELYVSDVTRMRDFYRDVLGFVVTDEEVSGEGGMVFLSRDPLEHHQLVLSAGRDPAGAISPLDHLSFRVETLAELRAIHALAVQAAFGPVEQVTHGTTWSVYFRDPEDNRLEAFVDTPWYTPQPFRERIDFSLDDAELRARTEATCRARPGFMTRAQWMAGVAARFKAADSHNRRDAAAADRGAGRSSSSA